MQTNITNRTISSAKIQDKPYEIRDTGLKGLLLRIQPSGVMTYYMEYKRGKRVKIGRADAITPTKARELARDVLADVYQGDDPVEKRQSSKADTYLQFLEETYKPWLISNLKTGQATFDSLKNSFPELHSLRLQELNSLLMERWRMRRKNEGLKASSINRQMNDLKACLNRAVDWKLLDSNPIAKVKPSKVDSNAKVRYLNDDEEAKLRAELDKRERSAIARRESGNEWRAERGYRQYADLTEVAFTDGLKPAVLVSLNTGMRRGELLGLKWTDINFEQKIVTVNGDTAKTGKTRHIDLNVEALSTLRQWKDQAGIKSLYVFTGKDGKPIRNMRKAWVKVLKDARLENFRWHDMRHTFASKLVMAGVDLNTVRDLLGHTDYKMTLRYAHLAPEHKAMAVSKLVASV